MKTGRKIRTAMGAIAALLFIFSLILPAASAISASVNPPKFTIKTEYLQDVERSILVENSGSKGVTVCLSGDVEGVELEFGSNDFTLSPGGSRDVPITFKIAKNGYFSGEIVVKFSEVEEGGEVEGKIASSITFPCNVMIDAKEAIAAPPAPTPAPTLTPTSTPPSSPAPSHTTEGKGIFGSHVHAVIGIVIGIVIASLGLYVKFGRRR